MAVECILVTYPVPVRKAMVDTLKRRFQETHVTMSQKFFASQYPQSVP